MPVALRFTITNPITVALTAIERARGFLEAATLSDDWIERISQRALLLEAHHTTNIEGTQLTLGEAARLWAGEKVEGASRDDVREPLNYRDAFNVVAEYIGSGEPITAALIREIHKRLVRGVRDAAAQPGQCRLIQNYVAKSRTHEITYTSPPPAQVPPLTQELVEWLCADTGAHPVRVAGVAQFLLVNIHPFVGGNGRASRLLSTLCLYRSGYDFKRLFTLSEFYDRDRAAFYHALHSVRQSDLDLTGWLEYFVEGLSTQMNEVKDHRTAVIRADAVAKSHRLGEHRAAVLAAIHEAGMLSLGELEPLFPDASRRSLQRDLRLLLDSGAIKESGAGVVTDPNRSYVPGSGARPRASRKRGSRRSCDKL